jgi:methylmalonyl-CoA mutase C-terminal domain/subunit
MENRKIRVLIAKPGLDGHNRGALVVSRALLDAGMEVIYTGIRQSSESIVAAAIQEDVDIIGLSILSGAHLPLCRDVLRLLDEKKIRNLPILVGGIIPRSDIPEFEEMGIKGVFTPGASLREIIDFIKANVNK